MYARSSGRVSADFSDCFSISASRLSTPFSIAAAMAFVLSLARLVGFVTLLVVLLAMVLLALGLLLVGQGTPIGFLPFAQFFCLIG